MGSVPGAPVGRREAVTVQPAAPRLLAGRAQVGSRPEAGSPPWASRLWKPLAAFCAGGLQPSFRFRPGEPPRSQQVGVGGPSLSPRMLDLKDLV